MRRLARWRQIPEALMALLGWLVIPLLPRRVVLMLARRLGGIAWALSSRLRRITDANLCLAFGDTLDAAQRREIGRRSFQSFALTLLDLFWFMRDTQQRMKRYVRADPSFMPILQEPPFIAVTAHFGNWEVMNSFCGLNGAPTTAVVMPLKNTLVDGLLKRLRQSTGSEAVPRQGAVRSLLKSLKAGRTVALVLDQNTLPAEGGIWVPFFGLPVPVSNAPGRLWKRTRIPVMVVVCAADRDGVYTMSGSDLFPPPGAEGVDAEALTRHVTKWFEDFICQHPSEWLWCYKRWKYIREDALKERYPFYAKTDRRQG